MIEHFAEYDPATGWINQCVSVEHPLEGDPFEKGMGYLSIPEPLDWDKRPSPSSRARVVDAAAQWVETLSIPAQQARALQQIDAAGEALRQAVVNHMPMQTEEYRQALQQAQAWRAADYPEAEEQPAPPDVVSWAMAKWRNGWTARQAADDILATATLWATVISTVRTLRLANKEDVRHAGDTATINAIVADMRADILALATQLGVAIN